ncbi:DUF3311 domain-containing protein [Prauserella cavernicola]|uniref:DUF3311 domain-containing protein n=1 Tax=Prauserella cavernicola TaxID=2800127 RepID=A0A934V5J0_9PSEU|nr:DUF3311 domain-containing protein [Prauserella cavernicola]MBK1784663.1 DUF3311 domain-containing protein [Prauserella cavernicola]
MAAQSGAKGSGLRFSPWNLLLIIPFWILLTPLYNRVEPTLFGMPFFYWFQFVGIAVGVTCTTLVYFGTKNRRGSAPRTEPTDVDDLDEGSLR